MLDIYEWNNKDAISAFFGYKESYFGTMMCNSQDKYKLISSFDDRYFFASILKYKSFLINLFYEASLIEMDMEKKEVQDILLMNGNIGTHRYSEFVLLINSVINEENFMTIQYPSIIKVLKFIGLCNELGYSNLVIELPIEIDLRGKNENNRFNK